MDIKKANREPGKSVIHSVNFEKHLTFNRILFQLRNLIKPLHQDPLTTQEGKAKNRLGITSLHSHANPLPEEHTRARVFRRDHQSSTNLSNQRRHTWAPHI